MIGDLTADLSNLPLALRDAPYGGVYQQRLNALGDELAEHDSLDGTVIGRRYEFILAEVITTDSITGNVETSWTLIGKPRELSSMYPPLDAFSAVTDSSSE